MPSFMSLIVLVLAASALSPIRAAPLEIERTMHSESSESLRPRRFQITKGKVMAGLFASLGTLALAGLVVTNLLEGWNSSPPAEPAHPPQTQPPAPPPSPSPTSPSQPATPPRALAEREVRNLDCRGLTLDTSKARSKPESFPDLLDRDYLGEALGLLSRIPDELD